MKLRVQGIPSEQVEKLQSGEVDANNQSPQNHIAKGLSNPCRHCLQLITEGDDLMILSYRPFDTPQPYAEIGPIFLHKKSCGHYDSDTLPMWFNYLEPALVRGYDENDWIRYDTAEVVPGRELDATCKAILSDESIAYVHIRSKYNCFQCRVDRD